MLQDEPYSREEAEQAAGLGSYVKRDNVVEKDVLNAAVIGVIGEDPLDGGMEVEGQPGRSKLGECCGCACACACVYTCACVQTPGPSA
jgi:hypothetical protein